MLGARLVQTKLKAWQFPTVTTYQGGLLRYVYPANVGDPKLWNCGTAKYIPSYPQMWNGRRETEKFVGVLGLTQDCRVVLINTKIQIKATQITQ